MTPKSLDPESWEERNYVHQHYEDREAYSYILEGFST